MNRVADKNGILAATRYRETAACGSGEGASSPHQRFAYREPMSTARRATPVAATTRYWRSQPLAGAAACCHSRTAASRTVSWQQSFYDAKERNTASARFGRSSKLRFAPFCRNPQGHWFCGRSAAGGCDTLLRNSRLREQPLATPSRTNRFAHRVMVATIRIVAFLASHPAKPNARPCGT
jgi:hypothetical protein